MLMPKWMATANEIKAYTGRIPKIRARYKMYTMPAISPMLKNTIMFVASYVSRAFSLLISRIKKVGAIQNSQIGNGNH